MITAVINTHALLKMLYSSLLAAVSVAVVFSAVVLGVIRSTDMRRSHRAGAATVYAALATIGLVLACAIVVYGLMLVARK